MTGASRRLGARGIGGAAARLRRGEQRDLGVGARQHDDVARGLGEIDRRRPVGDDAGLGGEEMHSVTPPPARRRSRRGRGPSCRSRRAGVARALARLPRPVEILLHPVADRLHDLPAVAARHDRQSL